MIEIVKKKVTGRYKFDTIELDEMRVEISIEELGEPFEYWSGAIAIIKVKNGKSISLLGFYEKRINVSGELDDLSSSRKIPKGVIKLVRPKLLKIAQNHIDEKLYGFFAVSKLNLV